MASQRVTHCSYALVYKDDELLFVRKTGEEHFHLPSVAVGGLFWKRSLSKRLYADYGMEGAILRQLPEAIVYGKEGNVLQHAFVFDAALPETVVGYEYMFLPEGAPELKDMDEGTRKLANRAFLYAPLYQERPRTVPLLPEDDRKTYWEIRCLKHFRRKIPLAERIEFESLVYSAASMRRINAAFVGLCNLYQVNPKDFIAYLERREKHREALQ